MAAVVNINDVLDGHVVLDLSCVDRLYLNAYVPNLQVGGQVVTFLTEHLGSDIPSPVLFKRIGDRFRKAVAAFADANDIPVLRLKRPDRTRWDDRKLDHVGPHVEVAKRAGRFGVVAIVAAQEVQRVFMGYARGTGEHGKAVNFGFDKADRAVTVYYFYVLDPDVGVGFIKICTYFPYPAKVWLNGHEWAKRQADRDGLGYRSLANGFATCDDPAALQEICDRFGPADVQGFFDRWMAVIPTPLDETDRAAGYWWELSMRQVEVSRTLCFDDPRRARGFFEALVADNIGIGRPEQVAVVFARRKTTREPFRTRVFTPGTEVKMDFAYKHSRVKQYLKEGRALRIETVINKPPDIGVLARLEHLPELVAKARGVNSRLLMIERAGQGCAIGSALFERIQQPYNREGQRTGALRFGDIRAMALAGALSVVVHAVTGFTNKSLRSLVAGLLGQHYTASQMSYDLRRLRLHGLIRRLPHTNTYTTTPEGLRVAFFYTKVHDRVLRPLVAAAHQPPAPLELRRALATIDRVITEHVTHARLGAAA
ncbi:MAG TPA: hypothetical protein VFI46_10035 [Jiangellaceae bacterium]|nr:hypothetical protein [Jiangellaceae bacterium]